MLGIPPPPNRSMPGLNGLNNLPPYGVDQQQALNSVSRNLNNFNSNQLRSITVANTPVNNMMMNLAGGPGALPQQPYRGSGAGLPPPNNGMV